MNTPFDDLIDRLTRRFARDPELRLELSHELRAHLEDSAAEFRAAGRSEKDAIDDATAALGQEQELSQQLWEANRRRMRMRKIARWSIGGTLVPAATVIAISATWTTLLSFALLLSVVSSGTPNSGLIDLAARHAADRVRAHIPSDTRDLAQNDGDITQRAARAELMLKRSPNDPVVYANYALVQVVNLDPAGKSPDLDRLLTILHRGASLEPDNALYPLLESAALFQVSSKVDQSKGEGDRFDYLDPKGKQASFIVPHYTITDAKQFDAALAAFRSASRKKYFDAHTMDAAKRQLALLPSNSLDGQLLRISLACEILLPHVPKSRDAYDHIGSVVLAAASAGDRNTAMDWIDDEQRLADLTIARSEVLVELISAARLKEQTIGQTALVLQKFGDHAGFERERNRLIALESAIRPKSISPTAAANLDPKYLSLSDSYFLSPTTDLAKVDLSPHRSAEYALFDQVSLTIGLFALLIVIAVQLLIAFATCMRRSERPTLYFIGWRRTLKIIGLSILLPAALYLAYAWSPFSGRIYGALALGGVIVVEYSLVGLIMLAIFRVLFDSALRQRAAELDLDPAQVPPPPSRAWQFTATALVVIALGYIVLNRWYIATHSVDGKFSPATAVGIGIGICIWLFDLFTLLVGTQIKRATAQQAVGVGVTTLIAFAISIVLYQKGMEAFIVVGAFALLLALTVVAVMRWMRTRRDDLPPTTWRIAIVPIELLAMLALALLVLPPLQASERRATTHFQKPVPYLTNEIENSRYHDLRITLLTSGASAARDAG